MSTNRRGVVLFTILLLTLNISFAAEEFSYDRSDLFSSIGLELNKANIALSNFILDILRVHHKDNTEAAAEITKHSEVSAGLDLPATPTHQSGSNLSDKSSMNIGRQGYAKIKIGR